MTATDETAAAGAGDDIKPYTIRVSSRYLELTKQKLELTRLPHEGAEPKSTDWWEPKPQIEPLVDFWLEKYSWRDQEAILNKTPQFRTAISIPGAETPLRLHFIHVRSQHSQALPLLLLPPFPFVNLALVHLISAFTESKDAAQDQPFHLVIPALPGLGFSDPFPNNTPEVSTTAEMLNTLMERLGYAHYHVSNTGAAQSSPAEFDWKLVERLSVHYATSCVAAHFIAPPLAAPKLSEAPLEWAKWTIANAFSSGILGYSQQDFSALKHTAPSKGEKGKGLTADSLGLNQIGLREPNTLAYAMCDSPTGLLAFALKGLSLLAPRMQFTPEQIITIANLAWLPGPEYAMRFWARCATNNEEGKDEARKPPALNKPKVAITVFLGGEDDTAGDESTTQEVGEGAIRLDTPLKEADVHARYTCPAWAKTRYNVLFSQRVSGKPGLLAWDRPAVILAGVRGLARAMSKVDGRLHPEGEQPAEALESIVIDKQTTAARDQDGGLKPPERPSLGHGDSSRTRVGSPDGGLKPPERPLLEQGDSSRTQVGSQPPPSPKGKELDTMPSATADDDDNKTDNDTPRPGTPNTIVMVTAPTDEQPAKS